MPNWKKLLTSGSDASLNSLYVDVSVNAASLTGSLSYDNLTGVPTLISGSEQVTLSSTNGFSTFSSSLDSRIDTEKSRVDAILSSATADADSFAEIVSLINSVDTTNDNAFASFYTASTGRLSSLEAYTASLEATNLISGSSQITISDTTGYTNFSSSIDSHLDANVTALNTTISSLSSSTATALRAEYIAGDTALSSSAHTQRVTLINSLSSSVSTDIVNLNTFSSSIQSTAYNFTGSFTGDGSGLTGVSVAEATTIADTLTNVTSSTITHNFDSYNVTITAYDQDKKQVIPESVTLTTLNTADITFCSSFSGTIVVAKGGHIVSGVYVDEVSTVSDTFTNVTSYTASHPFNTKNVYVTVYDSNDQQMLPETVTTSTNSTVTLTFCEVSSGRVLIAKAGHIVSGSIPFSNLTAVPNLISGSVTGSNVVGSDTITSIETLTSAAYTAITPVSGTLYIITD